MTPRTQKQNNSPVSRQWRFRFREVKLSDCCITILFSKWNPVGRECRLKMPSRKVMTVDSNIRLISCQLQSLWRSGYRAALLLWWKNQMDIYVLSGSAFWARRFESCRRRLVVFAYRIHIYTIKSDFRIHSFSFEWGEPLSIFTPFWSCGFISFPMRVYFILLLYGFWTYAHTL